MSRLLVVAMVILVTIPAALAVEGGAEQGHWEYLGEDGAIWVPDDHVGATYLPPQNLGAFHNHSELTSALQSLAASYPNIATLTSLGTSVEGRAIWALTLRAGADDGRPAVLFDGAHHGDEVIASEILLRYAENLTSEYPNTARSRQILENTTVVIVPQVNPDGISRAWNNTYYAVPRKNANGVDLNRNYAATWGGPGSSGSPSSATYRGPTPASEPETKALQSLLASRNWTFYTSLHSGAEMILWPYGHTTSPPPEVATYDKLGDELTALTSAPNGQVSQILYMVSGDSMDAAYINAGPFWKPLSTSPETYEGSGHANDWWYLFNPTDANIPTVQARWTKFLDHLATESPHYAPAKLTPPNGYSGPGNPFNVTGSVQTPLKRPFVSGSSTLTPPPFIGVSSANPIGIGAFNGTKQLTWSLNPISGGVGAASVVVNAGPAGNLTGSFPISVNAPAIHLTLAPTTVGSGQNFTATLRATSDVALTGNVFLEWEGSTIDARTVELDGTNEVSWNVVINAGETPVGNRPVRATFDYTTASETGSLVVTKNVFVDRPQLDVTRQGVPEESELGTPFVMIVQLRNVGTRAALDTLVRETLPLGYTPWIRATSTTDPVARPAPDSVTLDGAGRFVLEWDLGTISANGNARIEIGVMPARLGEHTLHTDYAYRAQYNTSSYDYDGMLDTHHEVAVPGPL